MTGFLVTCLFSGRIFCSVLPTHFFFFFCQTVAEAQGCLSQRPHLARQTRSWCLRTSAPLGGVTGAGKKGRGWQLWELREPRPGTREIVSVVLHSRSSVEGEQRLGGACPGSPRKPGGGRGGPEATSRRGGARASQVHGEACPSPANAVGALWASHGPISHEAAGPRGLLSPWGPGAPLMAEFK